MSLLYSLVMLIFISRAASLSSSTISKTLRGIPEYGLYNFTQMAANYGHPAEVHYVITEDGYNLTLFNLPGDRKRPVLLAHGLFDSASGWILRGQKSLGIILADAGYDVWLLNQRGCRYSREHQTLNPDKDAKFWDFSVHELGYYDLPAIIDYILNATGQSKLSLIGFSEGTTMGYVLGATKPEYNEKIKLFLCLAPVAFLHNAIGPLRFLILFGTFLSDMIPMNELAGYYSQTKAMINFLCTQLSFGYDVCFKGFFSPLIGPHFESIEESFFGVIISNFPAGTSKKNVNHFSQIGRRESFANFDYGKKNFELYGSDTPPEYNLTNVRMNVVLVSASNDFVSVIDDVQILHDQLPNVKEWKVLDNPMYNHLDHMWAKDAHQEVFKYVLDTLAKY